jgi:hypothetical protein
LTADVTVTPNLNEIRDYKYVDKAELQAMFEDEGTLTLSMVQCQQPNRNLLQETRSHRGSSLLRATSCLAGGMSCLQGEAITVCLMRKAYRESWMEARL